MASFENRGLWNFMLVLTILAGGTVTFVVLNKERYFPSLYSAHDSHNPHTKQLSADTVVIGTPKHVTPLEKETEPQTSTENKTDDRSGKYILIAGSFKSKANANKRRSELIDSSPDLSPEVVAVNVEHDLFYRIVVSRSDNYGALQASKMKLITFGYADCWIGKE